MNQCREAAVRRQGEPIRVTATVLMLLLAAACTENRITNPIPIGNSHPGFDTSIYPGDVAMNAWRSPGSPYQWVGYYLQAPCHRDASWMGKRSTLTTMGWGLAVLFVGQQTFDGVPDIELSGSFDHGSPERSGLAAARADVAMPTLGAELQSGVVTCSRTLLTTEQGSADAINAITNTAAEGFIPGTVIFLDIEHMDVIPASMEAYYRAWVQQVLADGRFRPGVYVHKANAQSIYDGVKRAYSDIGASGSASFWVTSSDGFSIDKQPQEVGFPWASVWQGIYEVTQTWNGATVNIDVDVASTSSPSSP